MRTIFDACVPKPDVLAGELRDEMFAAKLEDVATGSADPIYQDPERFFANSHPARGLQSLLREALGRATGREPAARPIIRLETAFGGGKTHSLIALYHLGKGARPAGVERFLDPTLLPVEPIRVVAVVGSALDPAAGVNHGAVTTRTIWGEIAYQAGAYEVLRANDEARTAPGTHTLEQLFNKQPTIVLIDELARYLAVASGHAVGTKTLADQTTAFLMALLEVTGAAERLVVVYTLASSHDAFSEGTEEIRAVLESKAVSARSEHVITPTEEDEIAAILRHRLFDQVDASTASEVAEAYHEALVRELERGGDLPANAGTAGYATDIRNAYPFHPELLRALNEKVATIPNFQRTRGALRLLAQVVRRLWERRPGDAYLIHPHHVDLSDEGILNDLTSRLDRPAFRSVVEADIANPMKGALAHAPVVDRNLVEAGRPPYGTRIATVTFLHSLVQGMGAGLAPSEANLAVFGPGDDLGLIEQQVERLLGACWYLDLADNRLRFSTEPSLVKIVADETQLIGITKAKRELEQRIRRIWPKGAFDPVFFPTEPSDVEESYERPRLAIMHFDAVRTAADREEPPELVRRIFGRAGAQENFRRFRNNIVFLVADDGQVDHAVQVARRYLALQQILSAPARLADFPPEQRERLKGLAKQSELELRVAVTRTYQHLFYPDPGAPKAHDQLARALLPAQDQGEVERDQSEVVLRLLRDLKRVLTADDPSIAPSFVRAKAWPGGERATTLQLRQEFASRLALPMLLDLTKLKEAVREGVRQGLWLYYDPRRGCAWSKESTTTPFIEISGDVELVLPEAAAGIPICDLPVKPTSSSEREETCPVCHRPVSQCICGIGTKPSTAGEIIDNGTPLKIFSRLIDEAHDREIARIASLALEVQGDKAGLLRDFRAMALAVPQLPKGQVTVDAYAEIELDDGTSFTIRYEGPWTRYRNVHDLLQKVKDEELRDASGRLELRLTFDGGLELDGHDLVMIRDIFNELHPGEMKLRAVPAEESPQ